MFWGKGPRTPTLFVRQNWCKSPALFHLFEKQSESKRIRPFGLPNKPIRP